MPGPHSSLAWRALAVAAILPLPGCAQGSRSDAAPSPSPPATATTRPLAFSPLPGAAPFDPSLVRRLRDAVAEKGPSYRPRTRHLNPDGSARYTNRLILESSPYLIQHAHNPVNWFPWGEEAFDTARRLGRPVLLSVGYSTCH